MCAESGARTRAPSAVGRKGPEALALTFEVIERSATSETSSNNRTQPARTVGFQERPFSRSIFRGPADGAGFELHIKIERGRIGSRGVVLAEHVHLVDVGAASDQRLVELATVFEIDIRDLSVP